MKTNQKIITAMTFVVLCGALIMTGCKPAVKHQEPTATSEKDTTSQTQPATEEVKPKGDSTAADIKGNVPLKVIITNLENKKAPVHVTFYQAKHEFLSLTDILHDYVFVPHGSTLTEQITDLKYGEYAIASYQDLDSDKKCDRNLIGIPSEPYSFSNNFKPTIRAPKFDECKFTYSAKEHSISFKMLWK